VVIIDIRRKLSEGDLDLLNWLKVFQIKPIIVLTKVDKLSKSEARRRFDLFSKELIEEGFGPPIAFSAKTGQGRQELWGKINEIAGSA